MLTLVIMHSLSCQHIPIVAHQILYTLCQKLLGQGYKQGVLWHRCFDALAVLILNTNN